MFAFVCVVMIVVVVMLRLYVRLDECGVLGCVSVCVCVLLFCVGQLLLC